MASVDHDVPIVGSGFGGSVAALRAAEKGYRVGVMESGRRWKDEDIPRTQWDLPRFLWLPASELYGIQRIEYLDDVLVLSGAGVGGGSRVYANTLYVPPKQFFAAPEWASITDWAAELAPCLDQATRMLGVVRYPYMPTDVDRALQEVAIEMGRGESFNKAAVAVYLGTPGVEAEDPYFGGVGPQRTGCISRGNCNIGCSHNAKNKLTTNYLYLAQQLGAQVHEFHEVHDVVPLDGGGFEVHARHPGCASAPPSGSGTRTRPTRSSSPPTRTARPSSCTTCSTRAGSRACPARSASGRGRTPSSSSTSRAAMATGSAIRVLVFSCADPDYFISHVDLTRIAEYRREAVRLTGEASVALLFRYLSASRLVSIAQIEGRRTGRALRLDQPGAARRRAGRLVHALAHRIAGFPAAGLAAVEDRVNAIALARSTSSAATLICSRRECRRPRRERASKPRCGVACRPVRPTSTSTASSADFDQGSTHVHDPPEGDHHRDA